MKHYYVVMPIVHSFKVSCDSRKQMFKVVPGWNDSVKHAHSSAREAYSMWCHVNKPRNGPYFEIMKRVCAFLNTTLSLSTI